MLKEIRRSRYVPDPQAYPNLQMTHRDALIIRELVEDQFLSTGQIQSLFFGSAATAHDRLRVLWHNGYVYRSYAPVNFGSSPAIYSPTQKGIDFLCRHFGLSREEISWRNRHNRVSALTKEHELDVQQATGAIIAACRERSDAEVEAMVRGPDLWDRVQGRDGRRYPIRPDRLLVLSLADRLEIFFLEVERSPKKKIRYLERISGYREYLYRGAFARKYHDQGFDSSFRVLVTVTSERKRNNMVEYAIEAGSLNMFWFSVFDHFTADPLGPVWVRGSDYRRDVLERVPYDIAAPENKGRRDLFVRKNCNFRGLLN